MPGKEKILVAWSGGKDSALMLREVLADDSVEVIALLTSVTEEVGRISMHGVREELLRAQAEAIGVPLEIVRLPKECPNEVYEERMEAALTRLREKDVTAVAFGDLFLEDIRAYRERNLAKVGMVPRFPIWGRDTKDLAEDFIASGFKAVLACVDTEQIDGSFAGREYGSDLIRELPDTADPCGENGEFHSFVHAGPMFAAPIPIVVGETLERDGFVFTDVRLAR